VVRRPEDMMRLFEELGLLTLLGAKWEEVSRAELGREELEEEEIWEGEERRIGLELEMLQLTGVPEFILFILLPLLMFVFTLIDDDITLLLLDVLLFGVG